MSFQHFMLTHSNDSHWKGLTSTCAGQEETLAYT